MDTFDWLDSIGSTQDELLRRLTDRPDLPHGTAVATADQGAGHGRRGRVWTAPPGSALALSVLLRPTGPAGRLPAVHLSWLSLVAAAAVAGILEELGADVHVKWPNDVLAADGRKMCGILATLTPDGGVVVGIGVNLDHSGGAPVETATALADWVDAGRVPAPRELAVRVREAVVAASDRLAAELSGVDEPVDGGHPAVAAVRARLSTVGRTVRAELPGGEVLEAEALGLGPGGTLRVRPLDEGRDRHDRMEREISAGDVVHLRGDVRRGR
ncbi:biotin--[acetyl-CoA-carboxylase] ligase [Micrococcus sp.]|uniref:biotin--[acetyl-CoA-carboxylase] ligase n=1 Tax=Micrococcus sp. TaxID=1271 RepID=UPI002A91C73F|nr:biotin--[acetyl-CoA-carboxylase] ligase [Micrococcus sp.]MDY6054840.1 biotin--[acetyl-CoA-carboxylase] ligase [Micrococcus sp.]